MRTNVRRKNLEQETEEISKQNKPTGKPHAGTDERLQFREVTRTCNRRKKNEEKEEEK